MDGTPYMVIAFVVAGLIEGFNGLSFALRGKETLVSAGVPYHDGPGLLIQEFGVYSVAIAVAYFVAAFSPALRPGILVVGISINVAAACMHLSRSGGFYFGGAKPLLNAKSERNQGLVHVLSLAVLGAAWVATGAVNGGCP